MKKNKDKNPKFMSDSIYSTGIETLGSRISNNDIDRQETITRVLTDLRQQPISKQITTQTEQPDPIEDDVEIIEKEFTLKNCSVLLATFFIFFVSWGFNASTGIILTHYLTTKDSFKITKTQISLISGIQPFLRPIFISACSYVPRITWIPISHNYW